MTSTWAMILSVVILANILGCLWLIRWTAKPTSGEAKEGDVTGHVWDDNLEELNNPMPHWWLVMFYITIVFGLAYIVLYPTAPSYKGLLGWTSAGEHQASVDQADETYGPIYRAYAQTPIEELVEDPAAIKIGQRLFVNYCAQCHGSDASGAQGFPNLTDNDWLWGGEPATIEKTILDGRQGNMPAWGSMLGQDGVEKVAEYVVSLSGRKHDAAMAAEGQKTFNTMCAACHMPDGTGNSMLGAPNLADGTWLFGASKDKILESISNGRGGVMPSHKNFLGEDKVHLLAAYVYSLSQSGIK